ncbi:MULTISPECIES: cysteine synthase family protein [unclassified Methylobacterium]|uniref:PLP-dependent cysteine synthase family protein n=1 Tax=unclassified Methylobacterium TaxID=2615210 RepID=UPI0008A7CB64|nr:MULTISPECIES: cysteine synthase family protein [unclassified Methylobacterium]SEH76040.1 cysteine synthase A [Methylobacterium sp. 275MFSha3.1]SFS42367.1 cysteine synthase A [Methylobacterium sp. yr668]
MTAAAATMPSSAAGITRSALDLIGNTPLVALDRVHPGPGRILAKAEFMQPGGSVKDRAARAILLAARADGRLAAGAPVVEMTSGNMGAGLAVACAALGHPLVVTMSAGNSLQRVRMLEALGAEVVRVPQVDGVPGQVTGADVRAAADAAERVATERGGFYIDQFHAPEGVRAHRDTTGPEIWAQSSGRVDAWVAAVGTGATFLGVAAALRARNPSLFCAAVEPAGCQPLGGSPVTKHRHLIQGTGYGSVPPHWTAGLMDLSIPVTDAAAEEWRRALATREGLHVGYSAAANVAATVALLSSGRLPSDATAVTVLCDTGLKY